MQPYRSDRVVRVLTGVVTFAYFAFCIVGGFILVLMPTAKLFHFGPDATWTALTVPTVLRDAVVPVRTSWGMGSVAVDKARGFLDLPVETMPWGIVGLFEAYIAVSLVIGVLTLHHLRRIFQRVRDGVPFDAHNATRMRTVGLLLLGSSIFDTTAEFIAALALKDQMASGLIGMAATPRFEFMVLFVSLVVIALAEVFRRGAELEDEQSLVV